MKVQPKQSLYKTPIQKHPHPPTSTLQSLHRSLFITKNNAYPHTAHNSTKTYTSNIKKQSTTPISRAQPSNFQDHDPYLHRHTYQNINEYEQFQSQSIQQKTMTVMNQLNVSYFYSLCVGFQDNVRNVMEILIAKILELEVKVAEVLGKFYKVEMSLHRKAKYIKTLVDENCVLIQLNRDVQVRMEQLRQKYEVSCLSMKSQWMGNVVDQVKNQISKYEIDSKICQGCQNDIKQQLTKQLKKLHKNVTSSFPTHSPQPQQKSQQFEQPSSTLPHKILEATIKSLKQILELCTQKSLEQTQQILKTKILENIDLKFEMQELEIKSKSIEENGQRSRWQKLARIRMPRKLKSILKNIYGFLQENIGAANIQYYILLLLEQITVQNLT